MADTSIQALQSLSTTTLTNMRKQVIDAFRALGGSATCDEIEVATGLSHQTASARVRDLVKDGYLVDTGARRATRSGRSARVYQVVTADVGER